MGGDIFGKEKKKIERCNCKGREGKWIIMGNGKILGVLIKGNGEKGLFIAVGPCEASRVNALRPLTIRLELQQR